MLKMIDAQQLEALGLNLAEADPDADEIRISNLFNDDTCLQFLHQFKADILAPNPAVAASLFMKRYARLVAASTLTTAGVDNCALSLPPEACFFTRDKKLRVSEDLCQWRSWSQWDREGWRTIIFMELFAKNLAPLVAQLERVSFLKASVLWENVAVRVNSVYRKAMLKEKNEGNRQRMISDFQFLKQAGGDLFALETNPLSRYLYLDDEGAVPVRSTCCMYYRLEKDKEGIGYCGNCPCRKKQDC